MAGARPLPVAWGRGQSDPNPDFCDAEVVRRALAGTRVGRPLHHAERLAVAQAVREAYPEEKGLDRIAELTGTNRGHAARLVAELDEEGDRDRRRRARWLH